MTNKNQKGNAKAKDLLVCGEDKIINLYSVSIYREDNKDPKKSYQSVEYYTAANIKLVIDHIKDNFDDNAIDVTEIKKHVSILAHLSVRGKTRKPSRKQKASL